MKLQISFLQPPRIYSSEYTLGSKLRTYNPQGPHHKGAPPIFLSHVLHLAQWETLEIRRVHISFFKSSLTEVSLIYNKRQIFKAYNWWVSINVSFLETIGMIKRVTLFITFQSILTLGVLVQGILSDLCSACLSGETAQTRWPGSHRPCWERLSSIIPCLWLPGEFLGVVAENTTLALSVSLLLDWFSIAAVANSHNLGDLNNVNLLFHCSWG